VHRIVAQFGREFLLYITRIQKPHLFSFGTNPIFILFGPEVLRFGI